MWQVAVAVALLCLVDVLSAPTRLCSTIIHLSSSCIFMNLSFRLPAACSMWLSFIESPVMYSLNCCSWEPANSTDHLHFTLYLSPSSPSAHPLLHAVIAIYFISVSFCLIDCMNSCFLIDCQHIWEAKSSADPSQSHINHRVIFLLYSPTSLWWIAAYEKEAAKASGLWGWNPSFLALEFLL